MEVKNLVASSGFRPVRGSVKDFQVQLLIHMDPRLLNKVDFQY